MKNLLFALFAPFLLFSQSIEEGQKETYFSYLESQGFRGKVTVDGDIEFMYEGKNYFLEVSDDETYFVLFDLIDNREEGCSNKVKKTVELVNGTYKTVNIYLIGDDCGVIMVKASSFLENKDDFDNIFRRSLSAVKAAGGAVLKKYSEL